jgi:hypothetical protein
VRSRDLRFAWVLHLRPACSKSQKVVKHDQGSPKLGQGPTGPQHSPVTRPESLWSGKLCFEGLELGSSCLNLLLRQSLLLDELLDDFLCDSPSKHCSTEVTTCSSLCSLSLYLLKKCAGFILYRLESLGHFHDFTLDGMDLLLNCALFL